MSMAGKGCRAVQEGQMLSDRIRRERKQRKVRADKAQLRRQIKQTMGGTIFLAVLAAGWA